MGEGEGEGGGGGGCRVDLNDGTEESVGFDFAVDFADDFVDVTGGRREEIGNTADKSSYRRLPERAYVHSIIFSSALTMSFCPPAPARALATV